MRPNNESRIVSQITFLTPHVLQIAGLSALVYALSHHIFKLSIPYSLGILLMTLAYYFSKITSKKPSPKSHLEETSSPTKDPSFSLEENSNFAIILSAKIGSNSAYILPNIKSFCAGTTTPEHMDLLKELSLHKTYHIKMLNSTRSDGHYHPIIPSFYSKQKTASIQFPMSIVNYN